MRPEWPGDGPRRAPEPSRDRWPGDRVRGAPRPQRDQWSGYEQQPYQEQPYQEQPYQERPYHQQPHGPGLSGTNPVAIASLLCAITLILDLIGFLGSLLIAIPAVICGGIALWQINARGGRGQGMAIAGLGIGLIGILLFIVVGG